MSSKRVNLLLVLATLATLSSCKVSDQEEESTTYDSEPRSRMMEILDIAKSKMARNLQTINLDKYYDGLFHPNSVAIRMSQMMFLFAITPSARFLVPYLFNQGNRRSFGEDHPRSHFPITAETTSQNEYITNDFLKNYYEPIEGYESHYTNSRPKRVYRSTNDHTSDEKENQSLMKHVAKIFTFLADIADNCDEDNL